VDAVARGGATEKELDILITRRHNARVRDVGERAAEEMWAESERRHAESRREVQAALQAARMSAVLEALIGHHQSEAEKYRENGHHEEDSCGSAQKVR
jgi:hypothetical protein